MDILADSPLIPASFSLILCLRPTRHPRQVPIHLCHSGLCVVVYGYAVHGFLISSHAPIRTGHLAKERPISWSLSFYLYSWLSGLVQLLFPLFMVLGGHGFVLWTLSFGTLFWSNLLFVTASFVACSCLLP